MPNHKFIDWRSHVKLMAAFNWSRECVTCEANNTMKPGGNLTTKPLWWMEKSHSKFQWMHTRHCTRLCTCTGSGRWFLHLVWHTSMWPSETRARKENRTCLNKIMLRCSAAVLCQCLSATWETHFISKAIAPCDNSQGSAGHWCDHLSLLLIKRPHSLYKKLSIT